MEFASEFFIKAAYTGLRITEVPITYHPRRAGESKLRSFRDGWRHLKLILLLAPKYLYYIPDTTALLAGAVLMLAALLRANLGYSPGIHSSILGAMLAILGYNLFALGAIADITLSRITSKFSSRITELLLKHLNVERALLTGTLMTALGLAYLAYLAAMWVASGYRYIPLRGENVIALVLLTLGIQTFFSSMMLYFIREQP